MFNYEFLKCLSDWQKGWREDQNKRRKLADNLVETCKNLPTEFKKCETYIFRKRFLVGGEIVPIILNDDFFEGIASWTFDIDYAKKFKGIVNVSTKFAMIFKQKPKPEDIIINICELWKSEEFKKAVDKLNIEHPEVAYPLLHFKDFQSEIIIRSTLKGSEIEHIVGMSSSFEEICDLANIAEEDREKFSKDYAKSTNGIPIEMPIYASQTASGKAVRNTILKMKDLISVARQNNVPIYNLVYEPNSDDLKHRL